MFVCLFYLDDKAEVGWSSELLPVVLGGVDVDVFKANQAGEIAGRLLARGEISRSELIIVLILVMLTSCSFKM